MARYGKFGVMGCSRVRTLALLCSLALVAAFPAGADALTKQRASQIAVKKLRAKKAKQPLVVFGLSKSLPRRTVVTEAVKRKGTPRGDARAVGRRFWLFWADLRPQAHFMHPSVLLLVDDVSGRVIRRRSLFWWPLVDGKRPPFLRSTAAYHAKRFRVFANVPLRRAQSGSAAAWRLGSSAQITGPPNVTNDCLIVMADRADPIFRGDLRAIERTAASLRLRRANARHAKQLRRRIKELRAGPPPCTDIVIAITAHGWPKTGSNYPHPAGGGNIPESDSAQVTLKTAKGRAFNFNARQLREIMRENSDVTFKLIVDACFSGRWVEELKGEANMRIAVASARSDQMGFGYFEKGARYPIGTQRNAVLTTTTEGSVEVTALNPFNASPFIAHVFGGISRWAASTDERQRTGDDLGKGIAAGFRLGASENSAAEAGWQESQISDHTTERPHGGPPTAEVKVSLLSDGRYRVDITANRPILNGTNIQAASGFQFIGEWAIEQCRNAEGSASKITCTETKRLNHIAFIHPLKPAPASGQRYGTAQVVLGGRTIELALSAP